MLVVLPGLAAAEAPHPSSVSAEHPSWKGRVTTTVEYVHSEAERGSTERCEHVGRASALLGPCREVEFPPSPAAWLSRLTLAMPLSLRSCEVSKS